MSFITRTISRPRIPDARAFSMTEGSLVVGGTPHGAWLPSARGLIASLPPDATCTLLERVGSGLERLLMGHAGLRAIVFVESPCRSAARAALRSDVSPRQVLDEWRAVASSIVRAGQAFPEQVLLVDVDEAALHPQDLVVAVKTRLRVSLSPVPSSEQSAADPLALALATAEVAVDRRVNATWLEIHAMCVPLGSAGADGSHRDFAAPWARLRCLLQAEATPVVPREQADVLKVQCRLLLEDIEASILAQVDAERGQQDAAERLAELKARCASLEEERSGWRAWAQDLEAQLEKFGKERSGWQAWAQDLEGQMARLARNPWVRIGRRLRVVPR